MKGNNLSKKLDEKHKSILQLFKTKNEELQVKELKQYFLNNNTLEFFESIKDSKVQRAVLLAKKELEADKKKEGMTQQMLFSIQRKELKAKQHPHQLHTSNSAFNDLIKTVLPDNYNEKSDSMLLSELAQSLEKYRSEAMEFSKKEEEIQKEKKISLKGSVSPSEEDEEKAKAKSKMYMQTMLKKISMPNDHFQLLMCLMKRRKEKEFEINPYVMNYKTSLEIISNQAGLPEDEYAKADESTSKEDAIFDVFKTNLEAFNKDLGS